MRIRWIATACLALGLLGRAQVAEARDPVADALDRAEAQLGEGKHTKAIGLLGRILGVAESRPNKARGHYLLARAHLESASPDTALAVSHYARAKKYGLQNASRTPALEALASWTPQATRAAPASAEPVPLEVTVAEESIPVESPPSPEPEPPTDVPLRVDRDPGGDGSKEGVLPDIRSSTDLARVLKKEQDLGYGALTSPERMILQIWTAGIQMAVRKVEQRQYDEARRYAKDVMFVAPDHWVGYYLMAICYWEEDDRIAARNWWKQAKALGFVPEPGWKDYTAEIEQDPTEVLRDYMRYARDMKGQGKWIEAEKFLLRTQNIQDELPDEPWVRQDLAEVSFMLGEIAYELQDWEECVANMDFAEMEGISQSRVAKKRTHCEEQGRIPRPPRIPVEPQPPEFDAFGPYSSVRLDLGRSYLAFEFREVRSGGKSGRKARALDDPTEFEVQGGRAYRVALDIAAQLRRAAAHAVFTALTMSILLR